MAEMPALLAPQRLFNAEPSGREDFLTHAAFLDRARTERDQGRERGSRIALGGYLILRLIDRLELLQGSTEDRESFRWQIQTTRRFLDELPQDDTETAHLQGILLTLSSNTSPAGQVLRTSLTAYAYSLEHAGRFSEALEVLAVAAGSYGPEIPDGEGPAFALFVGRLNRLMARWEAATSSYAAAEAAAEVVGDRRSILLSRLGRANVLRGQGNLPEARTAIERIVEDAAAPDLSDVRSKAYADLGLVFDNMGLLLESLQALYKAFEDGPDPVLRIRALLDVGIQLKQLGAYAAARQAFAIVSGSHAGAEVKVNSWLEMMDLESAAGNRVAFERCRHEVDYFIDRMPASVAVDHCYKLGIGMARFGQLTKSRRHLKEAKEMAERLGLHEWYSRVERVLVNLLPCADVVERTAPTGMAEAWEAPAIAEVAEGLERYASLMAG